MFRRYIPRIMKGVIEMGFFDEFLSTTKNVASTAGKKTDEAVKISKLKVKKAQINSDIKAKYEKLGALVYQMAKADEKDGEAFDTAIADIDASCDALTDIDKQIDELTGIVTCEKCGAKTKNDNNFCPKCGAKLPVIEVKEEPKAEEAPAEEAKEEAPAEEAKTEE